MFSFTATTDTGTQTFKAAYYAAEDGLVTFKDDEGKQIGSVSQHRLISIHRDES